MIKLKVAAAALAGVVLLAAAGLAEANTYAVVRTTGGVVVRNTYGNCVRTKWTDARDNCGTAVTNQVSVYFKINSSALSAKDKKNLAAFIGSRSKSGVAVTGYADRLGNAAHNERLAAKRAENVRSFLVAKGVSSSSIDVNSLGSSRTATSCSSDMKRSELIQCLREDRRVDVAAN